MIGIDPVASAMAEAARRAAGRAKRGRNPNALFVVASVESLPSELAGVAGRVTINLPWGSLLRGALALDRAAAAGIADLLAPDARVEMLLAPTARDHLAVDVDVARRLDAGFASDWASLGLRVADARIASPEEVGSTRTTWARRLGLGTSRAAGRVAWRIVLERESTRRDG